MMISTFRCFAVFLVVLLLASTGGEATKSKKSTQSKESKNDGVSRGQTMKQNNLPPGLAKKCEKPSFCLPNPCKNSGKCSVEDGGSGFNCTCRPPYTGIFCGSVVMDVANSGRMLLFDGTMRRGISGTRAHRFAVKDYLPIWFSSQPPIFKGFIIRVNGTFLDGDKIQCRNATIVEARQWTEANFKVPADGTWANPERGIAVSANLMFLEEDGSSYQPSNNLSLWTHGAAGSIFCRLELADLNLLE